MDNKGINISEILSSNPVFSEIFENSQHAYVKKILTDTSTEKEQQEKIIRYSFLLLNNELTQIAINEYINLETFEKIYYLLRAIDINETEDEFNETWGINGVNPRTLYFFYMAVCGLIANTSVKVQVDLRFHTDTPPLKGESWEITVIHQILAAIICLVRKNGIDDIRNAIDIINKLKESQLEYEDKFLRQQPIGQQFGKASNLLGYYHICKILTETASYLIEGYQYKGNVETIIQRHTKHASAVLSNNPRLQSISKLVYLTCIKLYKNCIWTQTGLLGSNIKQLCKTLNEKGIVDLLPSQQEAIKNNFLDPASSATILQMPTSAGKTLLAEFSILQTKALIPDAKIIYIVPTKALINQVLSDLRNDFKGLDLVIEKSIGAIELDPSEDLFLNATIDILVATPEKIDLLVRKKHPVVDDISLVVVDEAHNLNDRNRGARLELLLAILKREKPNTRYLLLTPFIPRKENGELLKEWLSSGKNAIPPIMINWKPADKIFLGIKENRTGFKAEILPNLYGWKLKEGEIKLGKPTLMATAKKERIFEFSAKHFTTNNKNILFLCRGKATSDKKANFLYENLNLPDKNSEKINLISKYIEEVIGEPTTLSKVLKKGIAVHHAGMTGEIKSLVEHLIRENEISHICATTTVAQGMNFPISSVYFDDYRKGTSNLLSISEFRNIAGRAGRTLVDNVGKIIFPFNSKANEEKARTYVSEDAEEITSALLDIILSSEEIIDTFSKTDNALDRAKLFENNEALSSLVQYIIHLINLMKDDIYIEELEELFKDSLGYHTLDNTGKTKFIDICKTLYFSLQNSISKGVLTYADKTGFSVPSVLAIMNAKSDNPEIASKESWDPNNLFDKSNYSFMTDKIRVIGQLREAKLGTDSRQADFNPEVVAKILVNWVNGENISNLSNQHPYYKGNTDRINAFMSYLTSAAFKSSWGLSALEGIVNSKDDDIDDTNSHIPSMVYYGVKTKEAVTLRMIGVPRILSNSIADAVFTDNSPKSYTEVRERISGMSTSEWNNLRPKNSTLNGEEWRTITKILLS